MARVGQREEMFDAILEAIAPGNIPSEINETISFRRDQINKIKTLNIRIIHDKFVPIFGGIVYSVYDSSCIGGR